MSVNVDGVYFDFDGVGSYYDLNKMLWAGGAKTTFAGNTDAGKIGYTKEIVLPPGTFSFTMRFVDAKQNVIASKQLSAPIVANQITTLTGKMFTAQSPTGFTTTVNQNWTTGSTVRF